MVLKLREFKQLYLCFLAILAKMCTFVAEKRQKRVIIPIDHIQFAGIVLMGTLTLMLLFLLPMWHMGDRVFRRSRWLMTASTSLLTLQFLLQYTLHFRQMGVTQAVMVNLLFFIPSAWLLSTAVLNLLRQGRVSRFEWCIGATASLLVSALLIGAVILDKPSSLADTPELQSADLVSAHIFLFMLLWYGWLNGRELWRMKRAMKNFYDDERKDVTSWMTTSVVMLTVMGVLVPWAIYWPGPWVIAYTILLYFTIYYCVISFYSYGIDRARQKMLHEAEQNATETGMDEESSYMAEDDRQRVEQAVNRWIERGGHLNNGITMQTVAAEIKIPRYQLAAWLKTTEWELFSPWLTYLRIEEAKRLITSRSDWSNDAIAQHCGFSSRSYFQTVFRKQTGMTPANFAKQVAGQQS